MKPTLLVLAAGMGSRFGSLKQVEAFGPSGETIIEYSICDAIRAGFGKVVFVIRKSIEDEFKAHIGNKFTDKIEVAYAFQELDALPDGIKAPVNREKPWGTGHALMVAESQIHEPFAVINADDFYGASSFAILGKYLQNIQNESLNYCLLAYRVKNTLSEYGSVSRGVCDVDAKHHLRSIVEHTKIFFKNGSIVYEENEVCTPLNPDQLVSMNMMGFSPAVFSKCKEYFRTFIDKNKDDLKAEFYLPTILNLSIQEGNEVMVLDTPEKWFGITYKEDKVAAVQNINERIAQGIYTSSLWGK